ncbi:MAG: Secretion system C-terminal sorting domain [Flavipsychrobacter sp.]|jgi:YVTN family beta-propeller protein|nr:Secretion system C-terminal sorting domain [Flavipsychrobacter sp.]
MKKIITFCFAAFAAIITGHSQPVLTSGFNGMASVNGTTYTRTGTVGDPTGAYAFVCASNDRTKFFAASFAKRYLYYVDPGSFNVTDSINYIMYNLTASNEPNTLFARTNNGLGRVNTLTKTVTDSVAIPSAQFVTERPNSKEVWVSSNNSIYVVDYTGSLTSTPFTTSAVSTDNGDTRFTKGGTLAYRTAWTGTKVYKINAVTKTVIDSLTTPVGINAIEVSADSSKIFVTFPSAKKVRIYATSTMTIIDSIDCGTREPFDIYRHPTRAEIWVVAHYDDTVTVFNEATHAQIATINIASSPHSLAFGVGTTSINEYYSPAFNIKAYPNPTNGIITISGTTNGDLITVYTLSGRLVSSTHATGAQQSLDISERASGNYIIRVSDSHGYIKASIPVTNR